MDIKKVKTELTENFNKAIYAIHDDEWDSHPLRVIQAIKSLIGINTTSPNSKLLEWVKEYSSILEVRPKSELMFKFSELKETITIHSLEMAIREKESKLAFSHLEQLCRVSDGRPILEFLLELSAQQTGKSFLFVLTALRSNLFLDSQNITALLMLSTQSILDDSFEKWGLDPNILDFESTFELICQVLQCHHQDLVRFIKIKPWLPAISKIINNNEDTGDIEDPLNILSSSRLGLLDYIDRVDINLITPKIILTLDAYRAALKVTPQYSKKIISVAPTELLGLLHVK